MNIEIFKAYRENKEEITLNDYLAMERTHLSVERTHLSYMRTVVSMIVAGITLLNLLSGWEGYACAGILIVSAAYFWIRGRKVCKAANDHLKYIEDEDD